LHQDSFVPALPLTPLSFLRLQTGPSTFFSAKQFEVFDIELLGIKNCKRRQIAFYSDLVCDDVVAEIPAELK
jgi:hypothetical protein